MDKENNKIVWLILLLQGCKLARALETNLSCNHPTVDSISDSCDEIIPVFSDARHQLQHMINSTTSSSNIIIIPSEEEEEELDGGPPALAVVDRHLFQVHPHQLYVSPSPCMHQPILMDIVSSSSPAHHSNVTLTASASSTTSQRPPTRKVDRDGENRQTIQVAAPEFGNIEMPQEDGFTWKKYGQKEILGCLFARSYYRCTHQKLYNCPAKKQVQRLDSNPLTYQVTYRGLHTCHLSPTAPTCTSSSLPNMAADNSMFSTMDLIFSSSVLDHDSHHIN